MWNMAYKNREESKELKMLRLLNARMELTTQEKNRYLFMKKGFDGEVQFDQVLERAGLDNRFYVLNDLLLKCDGTIFQIDSTLITQHSIIPFEIKNSDGNYYYQDNNFYSCKTKSEIKNPLHQLDRIQTMLRKLLRKNGFSLHVEGYVVFINPEFYLYQAPLDEPIVYFPQLNNFIKELNSKPDVLNDSHRKLADFLLKEHITDFPIRDLPRYSWDSLRKGLMSACCGSLAVNVSGSMMECLHCGTVESVESAVVRSVEEVRLLFPEIKITTSIIYEWCNKLYSKKVIRKILIKHFSLIGYGKWVYYE